MRTFILIMLAMSGLSAFSQTKAKDVFATAPDSIFPLLTTNNRLDCIDLIENNMKATVKNKLEQKVEMTALTDSYLQIKPSEKSVVEIKMLNDSVFCLINTCLGPAPDSRISFFTHDWKPYKTTFPMPHATDFWTSVPDSLARDASFAQRSLEDLLLIQISADKENTELTLTIQTSELSGKEKEIAQKYVQPLRYRWNGKGFTR
jgi:transcription antitermination factor NusG